MDKSLTARQGTGKLKLIGVRSRTIVTTFGEFEFRRRLYKNRETGDFRFLLDEALGLELKSSA